MADANEDVIPQANTSNEDYDLSDDTQDFRFLASITKDDAVLPKRGEKDFEPHATNLQSDTLAASRLAMHNALSFQRTHIPKNHCIATYHPETNMAYTINPKGTAFTKMGRQLGAKDDPLDAEKGKGQRMWLLPEEVLYLVERGSLDVHWPLAEGDEGDLGLPMSLQGAHAVFIGDEDGHGNSLTYERYSVYAGLKRAGYTVVRAPSWDSPGPPLDASYYPPISMHTQTWQAGLHDRFQSWQRWWSQSSDDASHNATGPLVPTGLYRSYRPIYHRLALISSHDPTLSKRPDSPQPASTHPDFRITYHVHKPNSTTFKKSSPGPPDFRIAVIDARSTSMPTLEQLGALVESAPYDPPSENLKGKLYGKLRYGYRNVIMAVVDQGVTSYLRVADAGFGQEKLFENVGRGPNAKRGGRGGGRGGRGGRGRGRG